MTSLRLCAWQVTELLRLGQLETLKRDLYAPCEGG